MSDLAGDYKVDHADGSERCPQCGAMVRPGTPACPACGVPFDGIHAPADYVKCHRNGPDCWGWISPDERTEIDGEYYCKECAMLVGDERPTRYRYHAQVTAADIRR